MKARAKHSPCPTKSPAFAGLSYIGAPRFELGTSSPPDSSTLWQEVRASGETWLGHAKPRRLTDMTRAATLSGFTTFGY